MSLHNLRQTYTVGALNEDELLADPLEQFQIWLNEALASPIKEATAMSLATVDADGQPSVRMVLLKGLDQGGFIFYSNYESRKGKALAAHPKAALGFYWDVLERQVRIEGVVSKLSREASESYFKSRPYGSQLGALASRQSEVLESRTVLEKKLADLKKRYQENEVPLPRDWGGYLVYPDRIEFWQGRPSRLHDRLRYSHTQDGWHIDRLSP